MFFAVGMYSAVMARHVVRAKTQLLDLVQNCGLDGAAHGATAQDEAVDVHDGSARSAQQCGGNPS